MEKLNLTELEKKFLETLITLLYAEPGFSDVDIKDISKEMNESPKVLRGVLASLIRKEFVSIGRGAFKGLIYLENE